MTKIGLPAFTQEQIDFSKEYCKVMEPVSRALDELQKDHQTGLGFVLPTITGVTIRLKRIRDSSLTYCEPLVDCLLESMERRFRRFFQDPTFILATLSNPFFKTGWIQTEEERRSAI